MISYFDIKTHVFPIPTEDEQLLLWKLEKIGIEKLKCIEMPFEIIDLKFYSGELPDNLVKEIDEGCIKIVYIKDKETERVVARTSLSVLMNGTSVFTRYVPLLDIDDHESIVVIDTLHEDYDSDDYEISSAVIWKKKIDNSYRTPWRDSLKPAEEWLNENYPFWKDPSKYWD